MGTEFTELEPRFHREAIANGCNPFGTEAEAPVVAGEGFDRREVVVTAMNDMLDGAEEGDFTADGKPDLRKLNAKVGFTVDRSERDALWSELTAKK